jgi:hypothetical protein
MAGYASASVRNAVDDVQLGPAADEQALQRVHLRVNRQRNPRVSTQGRDFLGVLRRRHEISEPFQVNRIGMLRGVPSVAM